MGLRFEGEIKGLQGFGVTKAAFLEIVENIYKHFDHWLLIVMYYVKRKHFLAEHFKKRSNF